MKSQIIRISEREAFPLAEKRFVETCRFDLNKEKHQRMMRMGLKVRDDGIDGIDIRALVSFYDADVLQDGAIKIGGKDISCNFFELIPEDRVRGVYLYMITAGECHFSSEDNIMDFLYADIWGTNYVDSGTDILIRRLNEDMKQRFGRDCSYTLSSEFGPGYFGMPVIQSKAFYELLKGEEIGVTIKESGLLIPQKSCTGLFFVLDDYELDIEPECVSCLGSSSGCSFCSVRTKLERNRL